MKILMRLSEVSGSCVPDYILYETCFLSNLQVKLFFLLIVLLGPHFASGGDSLLGTNLFFNILLVQETISVGEENIYIYSKEIVIGLVTCRWSMRKELGKNNKIKRRVF